MKWNRLSMCLERALTFSPSAIEMAEVLSIRKSEGPSIWWWMSNRKARIHATCFAQSHAAIYSASVVDRAMTVCRRDCQHTGPPAAWMMQPVTNRRLVMHCEKSESENAVGLSTPGEKVIPKLGVPFTYRKMCFAIIQCDTDHAA